MIIKYRWTFYTFSLICVAFSVLMLLNKGLNWGIDFKGGSLLEVSGEIDPNKLPQDLEFNLQKTENSTILRFKEIDEETHQQILANLGREELRFESIGPVVGEELKQKAIWAVVLVLILIIFYIAWAFRKIKNPFKYGLLAVVALIHDALITIGVFSFLELEINVAFIVAILTILGYSVNDTIVVFDRIRENLIKVKGGVKTIVSLSIKQVFRRSLFVSLTTLLSLLVIFFFGGESLHNFALALIVGISFGTYSSIFIASALLVSWSREID